MKNSLLGFGLMLISSFSYGQIIQFADPNFKYALVNTNCVNNDVDELGDADADINDDGQIDLIEASLVNKLVLRSQNIQNLKGIEYFINLEMLDCSYNKLKDINLTKNLTLNILHCSSNELNSLDSINLQTLTKLYCSSNKFTSLNLSALSTLQILECRNSPSLTSISLTDLPMLQYFDCNFNSFLISLKLENLTNLNILSFPDSPAVSYINLNNLPLLKKFEYNSSALSVLSITNLNSLELLICTSNQLKEMSLSNLPALKILDCSNNQLKQMNISNLPALVTLSCDGNQLSSLPMSNLPALQTLYCQSNQFTILDLNENLNLNFVNCNSGNLVAILIKNGQDLGNLFNINFSSNNSLKYICCDDKNINAFKSKINSYGYKEVEINSYCSFISGGVNSQLSGLIKYDLNNNGCDSNDTNLQLNKINIKTNSINSFLFGGVNGNYKINLQVGEYTIKPHIENSIYYTIVPDSTTISISDSLQEAFIQDFCITPKGIHKQVDLSILPLTPPARPGFDASYKVVMTNKGNQAENETLYFAYDEAKMDFVSTDVNPSAQSDGLLSWDFTDLAPFETRYYNVTLNVNSPSETPPVNAGDELLITCNILDNVFLLKQEVVGSYDPNDKTCLEGKTITPEQVGEYVHYLIRFENTGNYAAENVVVKDVIDESTFDISSLQITDASHEAWARINDNVVEFIFENIQLPFDDATNDGYICFKIKTKPTLILGNELKNEANIYFDYNLPILTNKTNTIVANLVGTNEDILESEIEIFPNPVSDVLKFSGDVKILKVEIFDMSGRLVQVSSVVDGEVNVERLLNGAYQMKVFTQLGVRNSKMMKL